MSGKKVVSLCENKIKDIVTNLGYYLVDVEYKKQVSGMVLEIVIDSVNGITLDDCEKVSRALDEPLDLLDPTGGAPYSLNVSSMGLDRPLTTEYAFNKYKDKEVEVKLYEPLKPFNKKNLIGVLKEWTEDNVVLSISDMDNKVIISRKSIAQIVPYIKF